MLVLPPKIAVPIRTIVLPAAQMVEAMRKRGVEVPYMVKDNEGHGFRNEENRFDVYRAMEQFFAEHLGGRIEAGEDVLTRLKQD